MMATARGDASVTRRRILLAARELFAARGISSVSIREIAAAAGVDHALVHRYFGTKPNIVAQILKAEAEAMRAMARPGADAATGPASLRQILEYALTEGRTSLVLILRAELDGFAPERMLNGTAARPVRLLADWLEAQDRGEGAPDPQVAALVLGAALIGLASVQPMVTAGAGLEGEDPEVVLQRCIDVLVGFAAAAAGAAG